MAISSLKRKALVHELFPAGLPRLWCPLLTHYKDDRSLDTERMAAHIGTMRKWISSFLVPGSTGDGWELSSSETDSLLDFLLSEAKSQDFSVMIGVLRTGLGDSLDAIRYYLDRYTSGDTRVSALTDKRICGFTVTPPEGADLPQDLILGELSAIGESGVPLAIYQLPQITHNEMSPETVASLVLNYPNVYLFKDTSGFDKVVRSGVELDNLFLVRGAEGRYYENTASGYDGFLLSTTNCFAKELTAILDYAAHGKADQAKDLSDRVSAVVEAVFAEAGKLDYGNPFSNANRAMDHYLAWGSAYATAPLPMTHSGNNLPKFLIEKAAMLLNQYGFEVRKGYLE